MFMDCLGNATPPIPFDFDRDTGLSSHLQTISDFGNLGCNDCVIAARAHHTIRLVWAREKSVPDINDPGDVINEYHIETATLILAETGSNLSWPFRFLCRESPGWLYGGDRVNAARAQDPDFCGPFESTAACFLLFRQHGQP